MPWDVTDAVRKDQALAEALADLTEPMRKAADIAAKAIDANFDAEASGGEGWAPLAESTIEDRKRKGFPEGPILQRAGDLRRDASAYREIDKDGMAIGPDSVDYAKYHASEEPRRVIPKRDFLIVGAEAEDDIEAAIFAHLEAAGG